MLLRHTLRPVGARAFSHMPMRMASNKPEPKTAANSLINAIPGNSVASKTAVATVGAGLAVAGISKELILIHPETIVLGCFASFLYFAHGKITPMVGGMLQGRADDIRKNLLVSSDNQKAELQKEIEQTKNAAVVTDIMKAIYAMKKDIIVMQAQVQERNAKKELLNDYKSQLDQLMTVMAAKRAQEQQQMIEAVRARVLEALKDPKFQDQLLKKCVSDIEAITA